MVSATAMHSIALFSYAFADSDAMAPSPGTKHYTCRELASLEVVPHPIKEFESVLSGPLQWRTSSRPSLDSAAPFSRFPGLCSQSSPSAAKEPFEDPAYLFELKLDGFRGLADTIQGRRRRECVADSSAISEMDSDVHS